MRKIDQLLEEYGESHQNDSNKRLHWVCVPLIFLSIIGLVWSIPRDPILAITGGILDPWINWATIALALTLLYYLRLSKALFFGMLLISISFSLLIYAVDVLSSFPLWFFSLAIFIMAWIGQFLGHKIEGKKPSFFKDLQFLLIGPAWIMHFIYRKAGIQY